MNFLTGGDTDTDKILSVSLRTSGNLPALSAFPGGFMRCAMEGNEWVCRLADGTKVPVQNATTATPKNTPFVDANGNAIQGTWGNGNMFLYRDGILVASNTTGTTMMPDAHQTFASIGANTVYSYLLGSQVKNLKISRR